MRVPSFVLLVAAASCLVMAASDVLAAPVQSAAKAGAAATRPMAERIKDLASVAGVRSNQLVGYGLVVGLDGTGDAQVVLQYARAVTDGVFACPAARMAGAQSAVAPVYAYQFDDPDAVAPESKRAALSSSGYGMQRPP